MQEALALNSWTFMLLFLMWFAAYMTGQGLANTWRPAWQIVPYGVMLGFADRFLVFALYDGQLLSAVGFLIDTAFLTAFAGLAYRLSQVHRMVGQYPWLYERAGPLNWRDKGERP